MKPAGRSPRLQMLQIGQEFTAQKALSSTGSPLSHEAGLRKNGSHLDGNLDPENNDRMGLWRIDEELAIAEFKLATLGNLIYRTPTTQVLRIDGPHAKLNGAALRKEAPSSPEPGKNVEGIDHRWTVFLLGLGSAVCGGTVVGWGITLSESNLIYWGIPILLVGMALIVAGLVFVPAKRPAAEAGSGHYDPPREIVSIQLAGESSGE